MIPHFAPAVRASTVISTGCWLVFLATLGCQSKPAGNAVVDKPKSEVPLRVLVVDDEPLAEAIQLAWDSRVGETTNVKNITTSDLLASGEKRLGADVVIYPSSLLGELAERELIVPLDKAAIADAVFDHRGIFELIRLRELVWGEATYAVPLGSPTFTLFYRKDIFAELNLTPPTTWSEYQTIVEHLAAHFSADSTSNPADQPMVVTAEPGAAGWAGPLLLARAAAYARHRNQYSTIFDYNTMEPLIAGPPFVRALQELVAAAQHGPATTLTPFEARRLFLAGQCAMALTWPSQADDASPELPPERDDWIGIAELPGAHEVYNFRTQAWETREESESPRATYLGIAGRLGSVTQESRRAKHALGMLFMLCGNELGGSLGAASAHTTLFRDSQLSSASEWVDQSLRGEPARQYGEVLQSALNRPAWLTTIRIPGQTEYLAALEQAIQSAMEGNASPTDALQVAAEKWNRLTEGLGRDAQQRAYMRSIGLNP